MRQKEVEIKGKVYKLQGVPFKFYMDLIDKHTDKNGNLRRSPYIADLFKHCVIEPKVRMSDFDNDFRVALKLSGEIENFLTGEDDDEAVPEEGEE